MHLLGSESVMQQETDAELVARTRGGDLSAFEVIVDRHRAALVALAAGRLGSLADAEDVAQDAFVQAYFRLHQLRKPEALPAWLRRLTDRLALMRLRRRREEPLEPERLERMRALRAAPDDSGARGEAREMLTRLPPMMRQAVALTYLAGYTSAEVASLLGVKEGTVKSRLSRARAFLREELAVRQKELAEGRPEDEFTQEVLRRVRHWERFRGSEQEKLAMVEADPEWRRLMEIELGLEPVSPKARSIRQQIASLEACHEHYIENVDSVLEMIGSMTPGFVLDCGQACAARRGEARAYAEALETWRDGETSPAGADEHTREVFEMLGERTEEKTRLVEHVIGKLRDNAYPVYADEDEDFELTESRIQHLAICNYNWRENLRVVLKEIAAGKRLFGWHVPDGYNAHGDCPDRVSELQEVMASAAGWAEGDAAKAGRWGRALGELTPEKRWLVGSLCKHVSAQHEKHGGGRLLARAAL